MRTVLGRSVSIGILALVPVLGMLPSRADAGSCGQVQLKDSSGVIGMVHGYTFSAVCSWSYTESKKSFSLSGFSSTSTNYGIEMDVVGKGKWDRKSGEAKESVSVKGYGAVKGPSGNFTGERVATGVCNQDPFLKDPPGGAAVCKNMNVQYKGASGPIFDVLVSPKRFLLEKRISLVEAQALSGKKSPGATPPPPPPKQQPKTEPMKAGDSLGAPGGMKASPGPVAAVAKPNLVVEGYRANVEPNCQSPKPAVTVNLRIRNSGGPLPANKGTVYLKEFGGASLSSGGVSLPAMSPGQQHTVDLPAISLQPYSSLSGKHSLQVVFTPQVEEGKPVFSHPSPPYVVTASFPADHCKSISRPPPGAAGSSAPARGGVPAAPPDPSRLPNR
jgi:hypothetical protein